MDMFKKAFMSVVTVLTLAGPAMAADAGVKASLVDGKDKPAGFANLEPMGKGLLLHVEVEGLSPGWHGIHIHGMGDCSDFSAGFKAAGGHATHESEKHGFKNADGNHFGDLPNIWAGDNGQGKAEYFLKDVALADLQDKDGSSIMVHAGPDDYESQPAGNSGDRVACGVIAPHASAQ